MKKPIYFFINVLIISALNFSNSYSGPRNVLVEYCTGTWCGYCPCGHQALNTITSTYRETIIIAYHGGASSADPWKDFTGNQVRSLLGFSGYPTAVIDRGNTPSNPSFTYNLWYGRVDSRYLTSPNSNVNLVISSKSYNETSRELSVTLDATALENLTGDYKVSFVIVENNLVYPQNHYAQCGTTGYVPDYVHAHVARNMVNGPTGENLNSGGVWNINETLVKKITTVIDASWVETNCKLIAFVYKDNAVLALANVEQAIEEDISTAVGISGNSNIVPNEYSLSQNFPNPFNPSTNIKFALPKDGVASFKVYDIFGKEVENYADGFLSKGTYNYQFDGTNLSSGIYFYVLKADNYIEKKKMMLIK
ncbi:MAG: Omp28-related outer membrane protein [Bacteroidota bacterium]|nr:Omp28-related outer membrane protein [Bacteroidota bacterium]